MKKKVYLGNSSNGTGVKLLFLFDYSKGLVAYRREYAEKQKNQRSKQSRLYVTKSFCIDL